MEEKKEEETKKPIISVSELNILEKKKHNVNLNYYKHLKDVKKNEKFNKYEEKKKKYNF